jgi:hypothetical protein
MKFTEAQITIVAIVGLVTILFSSALWFQTAQINQAKESTTQYLEVCVQDGYKKSDCIIKWVEAHRVYCDND